MSIAAGTTLGPYRVLELIAQGGMATVYKAEQPSLGRLVAIKVLPRRLADDPDFRARFEQEARAVAALRHSNILAVHDFGEHLGLAYMVLEFVDGGTLAERVGKPLPLTEVVRLLGPVAAALDYAHARGVVHRDVKPSNVLLTREGQPVLSDFGLARMLRRGDRLTSSPMLIGTPEYMAPEQATGGEVGEAADRYALGVIAYELLTGTVPFSAEDSLVTLLRHANTPVPPPRERNPELNADVEHVLLRGLAKAPAERYATATGFVLALEEAGRAPAPLVAPEPPPEGISRRAALLGAVALALLVIGGVLLARGPLARDPLEVRARLARGEVEATPPGASPRATAPLVVEYTNRTDGTLTEVAVILPRMNELGVVSRDRPEEVGTFLVFRQRDLAPRARATFELAVYPRRIGAVEFSVGVRARGTSEVRVPLALTGTR